MINGITIEICCGSYDDVLTACAIPEVDRIELNCALELGGLTPSFSLMRAARKATDKKIIAMVRPRPAGFCYTETEKEMMFADAEVFLKNGADGIVFGFLQEDGSVDEANTRKMAELIHSYQKEAVFHKAFDAAEDPFAAIETLLSCQIDRILTSGKEDSVIPGIPLLKTLHETYGSCIEILPGGGVSAANALQTVQETGIRQLHMSAKSSLHDLEDYYAVDAEKIRAVLHVLSE
ncbi:MAG: copper homeostasis protein CutC [Solobacterium sp.]|nr:copper homeostasis protein CutC [Solobacterium sp.]